MTKTYNDIDAVTRLLEEVGKLYVHPLTRNLGALLTVSFSCFNP